MKISPKYITPIGAIILILFGSLGLPDRDINKPLFDPDKVEKVELIKVDPEDPLDEVKTYKMPVGNKAAFLAEFMKVKSILNAKMKPCYKFRIYLVDGGRRTFWTDGKYFYRQSLGYYQFLSTQNLILKYWELDKKDLCK